ncbi:MAG TPA: rod shape-determining protein MreC [Candidatus Hydrogenedentes bacterium]|nr:rod shape-determining protein MreC [Candidatus Hydrogenedentota bacterium]HOS03708.1 rod shape-determining protein MreC [Candidatus Hydrogenedentota bacterium]
MTLGVLVLLSCITLASGSRATFLSESAKLVVTTVAHPFWRAFQGAERLQKRLTGFVTSYGAAQEEAARLRAQLAEQTELIRERNELKAENARFREMLSFVRDEPRLTLEPVSVIARAENQGAIIVDRGAWHGVEESMCLIRPEGVVGIVTKANPLNSIVFTVHHVNFKIGAMVKRSRVRGSVHGSGSGFSKAVCTLQYIDAKDDVRRGDQVVTSGEGMFPSGYLIGTITEMSQEGYLLRTATVEPAVDPYRIDEAFLVRRARPAQEELAGPAPARAESSAMGAMSEAPSLQERYAP